MLRINLTLLFTSLYIKLCLCQGFTYHASGVYDTWGVMSVVELDDHYLFATNDIYTANGNSRCKLTKISKEGIVISDTLIYFDKFTFIEILHLEDGRPIIKFIGVDEDNVNNAFVSIDLKLNSRQEVYFNERYDALFADMLKISDTSYFAMYNGATFNLYGIDVNNSRYFKSVKLKVAPLDIAESLDKDKLILKGLAGFQIINKGLDTSFIITEDYAYGDYIGDIIPIVEKMQYINTGGYTSLWGQSSGTDSVDMGVSILDLNFDIIKIIKFGRKGDTMDIPARGRSIAITDGGYYFAGMSNCQLFEYPYGFEPSWYFIVKADSNLNIKWYEEFGGDAYYYLTGVVSTSDGGCILYGTRQDTTDDNYNRDAFLIKLDQNGVLVFNKTIPADAKAGLTLYPNPTRDQLNIVLNGDPRSCQLKIYNLSGAEIKAYPVMPADKVFKLHVSGLAPGEYILKAFDEKQNPIGTGRFVKM